MRVIGLTGGIGSGKTTVSDKFMKLGIEVIDADVISRECLAPGAPLVRDVVHHFSRKIVDDTKSTLTIDRDKLRALIFNTPEAKHKLESLVHPVVRKSIVSKLSEAKNNNKLTSVKTPYLILSSPLLFETAQDTLVEKTILVDVPKVLQIKRTKERDGMSEEEINKIIDAQMSRAEKKSKANYHIDNTDTIENTFKQVMMLHNMLMSQS